MEPYDRNIPFNQLSGKHPNLVERAHLGPDISEADQLVLQVRGIDIAEPIPVCEYDCPPGGESQ